MVVLLLELLLPAAAASGGGTVPAAVVPVAASGDLIVVLLPASVATTSPRVLVHDIKAWYDYQQRVVSGALELGQWVLIAWAASNSENGTLQKQGGYPTSRKGQSSDMKAFSKKVGDKRKPRCAQS